MTKLRKMLLTCICFVAMLLAVVTGTLAWLTDTDSAVNTFTVGHVQITLDEAKVNADGTLTIGADRVKENQYHVKFSIRLASPISERGVPPTVIEPV